jgi:hypothetical protein
MLKDRRALLEREFKIAHDQAAKMYLEIVTKNEDGHNVEYHQLRDKISKLEFDLSMINQLIHQGHE